MITFIVKMPNGSPCTYMHVIWLLGHLTLSTFLWNSCKMNNCLVIYLQISGSWLPSGYRSSHQGIAWVWFCYYGNYWKCRSLCKISQPFCAWRSFNNSGKGTLLSVTYPNTWNYLSTNLFIKPILFHFRIKCFDHFQKCCLIILAAGLIRLTPSKSKS